MFRYYPLFKWDDPPSSQPTPTLQGSPPRSSQPKQLFLNHLVFALRPAIKPLFLSGG